MQQSRLSLQGGIVGRLGSLKAETFISMALFHFINSVAQSTPFPSLLPEADRRHSSRYHHNATPASRESRSQIPRRPTNPHQRYPPLPDRSARRRPIACLNGPDSHSYARGKPQRDALQQRRAACAWFPVVLQKWGFDRFCC